jgi:hypothetical protein
MPRQFVRFGILAALVILFSHDSLHAQAVFHPDSQFGPYALQATLIRSDATDEEFGRRVALVGDVALVAGTGTVYVFERDPATGIWQEVAPLQPDVPIEGFGRALAFEKNTAIVGSLGAAHLFRRRANGQWREVDTLTPSDGHPNFGASVDLTADQAIVGAIGAGSTFGSAYIFRRDSSGTWSEVAALVSPEASDSGRRAFGYSVAIGRDAAVVGTVTGPSTGAANIFVRDAGGVDNWGQVRRAFSGAGFPGGVAIGRDTAVFGFGEGLAGAFILYRDQGGSQSWGIQTLYGSQGEACCGTFRTAQIDGDRIILGLDGLGTGVHVLSRNQGGQNAWRRIASFIDVDRNGGNASGLGAGVSISGDTILIGAPRRSGLSVNKGVFVLVSDLDGDGVRDALDPCPSDPLNNVAGNCKRSSSAHPVLDDLISQEDVTSETQDGRQIISATFTNTSATAVKNPFFEVTELSGRNVLVNADEGRGRVGATLSPDVGDGVLSPGESMTVTFRIRLRTQDPFQFFVAFHGDPAP